ncbi:MAG: hypothetical protein AVDCRST_MAG33-2759 [uncultured Thermomicrobiales bacterium]|uniref:Uncharacterized protein n=1 Tax=uncultured Thermomicrobiales bacterium TaxID=1645740 RepID=A0A6J4VDQ2_9BACT|nr:MAG: hypothetical protein AVDCRST_MAG33-2759 [uncultured Thermomicrobiales bacterium]
MGSSAHARCRVVVCRGSIAAPEPSPFPTRGLARVFRL